MMLFILATFYLTMVVAAYVVEVAFGALGCVPSDRNVTAVMEPSFSWNYTTFLNIVFLVVLAGLWWLARNQHRLGGGAGYAIDPVCGMQVEVANAAARSERGGDIAYFCSDHCRERFEAAERLSV
jgi:YHS domain-containing protein